MGHTHTKIVFVVYQKFKFNSASGIFIRYIWQPSQGFPLHVATWGAALELFTWNHVAPPDPGGAPPHAPHTPHPEGAPACPEGSATLAKRLPTWAGSISLPPRSFSCRISCPWKSALVQNHISGDITPHINHPNWIFKNAMFLVSFLYNQNLKMSELLKKHSVSFGVSFHLVAAILPPGCSRLSALPCGGREGGPPHSRTRGTRQLQQEERHPRQESLVFSACVWRAGQELESLAGSALCVLRGKES